MDTCVDAAGTVIEEFNAEFGAGSINIPTNFDTEVDGEGRDPLTSRMDDHVLSTDGLVNPLTKVWSFQMLEPRHHI